MLVISIVFSFTILALLLLAVLEHYETVQDKARVRGAVNESVQMAFRDTFPARDSARPKPDEARLAG
jgi:hypothetical protein